MLKHATAPGPLGAGALSPAVSCGAVPTIPSHHSSRLWVAGKAAVESQAIPEAVEVRYPRHLQL